MIRHWNCHRAGCRFTLHGNMAAASPNFNKPCFSKIAQTSLPEKTRNLANRHLQLSYVNFSRQPLLHFFRRCAFKKQLQSFAQILTSAFNAVSLTGDVQFWTQRNITITFPFNNCGQLTIYSLLLFWGLLLTLSINLQVTRIYV